MINNILVVEVIYFLKCLFFIFEINRIDEYYVLV